MKNIHAEMNGGKITVVTLCDDLAKHKIITEFSTGGVFLSRRTDYVYGRPAPIKDVRILPLCFFEAIAARAFDEAVSYLSTDLRQDVPAGAEEDFFRGFFGDFIFAYPEKGGATALIIRKENGYETKLFTAEIVNGFIVNFN